MTQASRRADFFALEANEYLAELEPLVTAHDRPDAERLVRGARALRGAALMAGLGTYARAAAGLETIAKQVRDHALAWEPGARQAWIEGVALLRALVGRAATWEAADDRQALLAAERFDEVITGRPARAAPTTAALTPGVRAFIARESALIAGSLEQASRALAPIPPAAALAGVLERMQSLRGLGASAELSPLPELLDAMEIVTRTLLADVPAPPNVAAVFADAAHAMSTMARAVAEAGQITPPPELETIARRLLDSYAAETDVVAIESLAPDGVDPVARIGTPPSALPDAEPVPVEMVSVGDHLLLVADSLTQHPGAAARDLRLFVLHRTLASMPSRSATGRFLAPLAGAIGNAISYHVASERPDGFIAMLRGCGRFLVEAAGMTDRVALTNRRDAIATSISMIGMGAPVGPPDAKLPPVVRHPQEAVPLHEPAPPQLTTPQPAAQLEPEPQQVMPPIPVDVVIATPGAAVTISWADEPLAVIPPSTPTLVEVLTTLAPAPEREPPIVSIDTLAPDDKIVDVAALAPDEPIVDIATLGHDESDVVPIESLADDETDVVSIESLSDDESDVVSIESLAADESDVVSIESLAPDRRPEPVAPTIPAEAAGEPSRLEVAFARRRAVATSATPGPSSLGGLIAAEIVEIDALLYRGDAAAARIDALRGEVLALLTRSGISVADMREPLDELLDLIPMARDAA